MATKMIKLLAHIVIAGILFLIETGSVTMLRARPEMYLKWRKNQLYQIANLKCQTIPNNVYEKNTCSFNPCREYFNFVYNGFKETFLTAYT